MNIKIPPKLAIDITRHVREYQRVAGFTPLAGTPQIPPPAMGPMVAQMLKEGQGLGGLRFTINDQGKLNA